MLQSQTQILANILAVVSKSYLSKLQLEADLNLIVSGLQMREKGEAAGISGHGFRDTIPTDIYDNSGLVNLVAVCINLLYKLNQSEGQNGN